jgi:hypothetical protein
VVVGSTFEVNVDEGAPVSALRKAIIEERATVLRNICTTDL